MSIALLRCHHHPEREASARCPQCRKACCRECVTEHQGRVLCSDCLRKSTVRAGGASRIAPAVLAVIGAAFGVITAWLFFALVGKALASVPASVHDGAVWHTAVEEP